jgi:PDZ domain-containing protein
METTIVPSDAEASPAAPAGGRRARGLRSARRWALAGIAVLVGGILLGAAVVQLPYYALEPGLVRPTSDLISVDGVEVPPAAEGSIAYTTVRLKQMTLFEMLGGWVDPDVAVFPRDQLLGNQSERENRVANLELMDQSKEVATEVALRELGYPVTVRATGFVIAATDSAFPAADEALDQGDVIVGVDGERIDERDDLSSLIGKHAPGETVDLAVEPAGGGPEREVSIVLSPDPDDPSRAIIGVRVQARDLDYAFPFDVTIDSGTVGGNSAGLAFTLGIIDLLTEGELTGGHDVAVTGTMEQDGTVGEVGGVGQKIAAARKAGIEAFLAPSAEYDEAVAHSGDVDVYRVDTLDQALAALAELGGNGLALPEPTELAAS